MTILSSYLEAGLHGVMNKCVYFFISNSGDVLNIFWLQLLKVYVPKFETGGEFWPTVHNSTIFSLILMHIIGIGIFGLKKLPLASVLTLPLPILTLLFNEYCQKRFLPIFKDYPAEVC